ncbi:ATP-binding cassette domain-containing protein [Dactylosporangium sp. CA-092794]|uniref:ATP-binding cassette domain-containing protein n=1 Tax=Dactylosporangium sp. CA-092794 TaxID=3239929 RepID=UPI003D906177
MGGVAALRFEAVRPAGSRADLTATVYPGGMTGLVCEDPVAAAAVPALLARERDPEGGRILLDGRDIATLPLPALRATVLAAPHDAVLLPGTIADNLAALSDDPAAVGRAARAAFADQVVDAAPDGDHTGVGDRGETLSGGQRQRIALARVLAADPPVLVLHEPTTAVDAATEDRIARGTAELRGERTTLIVSTSPAWLARCRQVMFLHRSGCSGGTHADLLAASPTYRDAVTR